MKTLMKTQTFFEKKINIRIIYKIFVQSLTTAVGNDVQRDVGLGDVDKAVVVCARVASTVNQTAGIFKPVPSAVRRLVAEFVENLLV